MIELHRFIKTQAAQDAVANGAATLSAASAGWAWLAHANELLTTLATIIAIVSGLAAIRYHVRKTDDLDQDD